MVIELQMFMIKKNHTCFAVISLDLAIKNDETINRRCFQKSVNTFKKFRHNNDDSNDFSYSSDDSDEEQIKAIRINIEFLLANENMIYNEVIKQKSLYID